MILPGEIRWCSRRVCYKRCLEIVIIMPAIIRNNGEEDAESQFKFMDGVIETKD